MPPAEIPWNGILQRVRGPYVPVCRADVILYLRVGLLGSAALSGR